MKSSKDKIQSKIDKNRSENGSNLFEILSKTLSNLKSERSVMTEQEDDIKAADIDSGINIANERFDFSSPKSRNVEINLHLHRSISKQLESPSKLSSLRQPRFDPFSW